MIGRFFKRLALAVAMLAVVILGYLGAAALGGLVRGPTAAIPAGDDVRIGLLYGPIHVDFLIPATDQTRRALAFAEAGGVRVEAAETGYFIVGWGAREFYTTTPQWSDLSLRATARAITGDASVLRVDALPHAVAFDQVPHLDLSSAQYTALLAAISATAAHDASGIDVQGYPATSGFIEARGRFHILRTCNTWVGRSLRSAGVPMGLWTPTPFSVRLSLWRAGI